MRLKLYHRWRPMPCIIRPTFRTLCTWILPILVVLGVLAAGLQQALANSAGNSSTNATNQNPTLAQYRIHKAFPDLTAISEPEGEFQTLTIYKGDDILGYAFESINVTTIPAYSGKPINMLAILDTKAVIRDAYVLEHHEPILLIGIPEEKLHTFNTKYEGVQVEQRVVVGRSNDPDAITVDAITGATVTVMVINDVVMRSAHKVAI